MDNIWNLVTPSFTSLKIQQIRNKKGIIKMTPLSDPAGFKPAFNASQGQCFIH